MNSKKDIYAIVGGNNSDGPYVIIICKEAISSNKGYHVNTYFKEKDDMGQLRAENSSINGMHCKIIFEISIKFESGNYMLVREVGSILHAVAKILAAIVTIVTVLSKLL